MQAILLALLISSAATPSQVPLKLDASEVTRLETRYIEGLRTSFQAFELNTARFIRMVNGPYAKKSPEDVKKMEAILQSLQRGERTIHALHAPQRVKEDHARLVQGCNHIVSGAKIFFDLHRVENPQNMQDSLIKASQFFKVGRQEVSSANAAISGAWIKKH